MLQAACWTCTHQRLQPVFEIQSELGRMTHTGRQWCRLWIDCEFPPSWPWSAWELAPRLSSEWLLSLSPPGSLTQALWTPAERKTFWMLCVTNKYPDCNTAVGLHFNYISPEQMTFTTSMKNAEWTSDSRVFWCRCEGQGTLGSGSGCEVDVCVSVLLTALWESQVDSSLELKFIKSHFK